MPRCPRKPRKRSPLTAAGQHRCIPGKHSNIVVPDARNGMTTKLNPEADEYDVAALTKILAGQCLMHADYMDSAKVAVMQKLLDKIKSHPDLLQTTKLSGIDELS